MQIYTCDLCGHTEDKGNQFVVIPQIDLQEIDMCATCFSIFKDLVKEKLLRRKQNGFN